MSIFHSLSFLIYCCINVFFSLFLSKRLQLSKNWQKFHWQDFILYKTGENLKVWIEIFCQKFNVVLAFSSANHGGRHKEQILFKISGSVSAHCLCPCIYPCIYLVYIYVLSTDFTLKYFFATVFINPDKYSYLTHGTGFDSLIFFLNPSFSLANLTLLIDVSLPQFPPTAN